MQGRTDATVRVDDAPKLPRTTPTLGPEDAWLLLLAIRAQADQPPHVNCQRWAFSRLTHDWLTTSDGPADLILDPVCAELTYCRWPISGGAALLLKLLLGHALRPRNMSHIVALLGQSLDGFIATRNGDSRHINGQESLTYLHRLRALSDAVLIGVGTAIADRPRLTTRHAPGPHAARVVIDPRGRLPSDCSLLNDGAAPTVVIRATEGRASVSTLTDGATALHLPASEGQIEPADVVAALAERGMTRLLVEGGGVTVGRFLEARLLDRLQLAVSPVIIGAGRPALPVRPADRLDQAIRPACARHLLGEDVLFDLSFGRDPTPADPCPQSC
jgi:diaminohydroxyphosphoribosylaminopyrimidine deaminase / 5-amino-6-(5-phosphoribosylamino)uracil reductase